MSTPHRRLALPLLLAVLGVAAAAFDRHGLVVAGVLLFCPGWGLLRVLSVADRNFGVYGSAVCLSVLLLGLAPRVPHAASPLVATAAAAVLCAYGTWRMRRHDRWLAEEPPHPDPMPLWPARTPMCIAFAGAAIAAVVWARPLGTATLDGEHLVRAAEALGWARGGEDPFVAGTRLPEASLFEAAVGSLSRASRLHPLLCVGLVTLVSLSAVLAFVAEGISRLWGNRGGTRAMLAFLIGLNPLGTFFMLGARDVEGARAAMSPSFDAGLTAALQPFVDGSPLALTLAFVAMMQSCTLSILRRSSTHIPRLLGVSTFALVLTAPEAAMLLVPGWVLGIGLSHIACVGSVDNDPQINASVRRRGEPVTLRSPFWRPVLHMIAGLALAAWIVPIPDLPPLADVRPVAWALLSALGPTCLLFMPGIRHLNASPGREAYHFVGLVATTVVLLLTFDLFGDDGNVGVRLLSLLLAVPCANGAMKMIEIHGMRARLYLTLLVVLLLPSSVIVLWAAQRAPVVAAVEPIAGASLRLAGDADTGLDGALLAAVAEVVPEDAVVAFAEPPDDERRTALVTLATGRPLLAARAGDDESARRRLLVARLRRGDATASWSLLETPALATRALLAVDVELWPGFEPLVHASGGRLVQRARRRHVVLVTADGLRADELDAEGLPSFAPRLDEAMVFDQALSPCPTPATILSRALTTDLDARSVPAVLAERGLRTAAWTSAPDDVSPVLAEAFGDAWHVRADAPSTELADAILAWIAEAPEEPAFAWLHVDADTPDARDTLDRALYRLAADLGGRARLILTAPRGRPDDSVTVPFPDALTEAVLRVPFVIVGGGAPATHTTRLVSVTDVGALLTTGVLPPRDELELRWVDPADRRRYTGIRTRHEKTIDVEDDPERGPGRWTIDLTTPHGEAAPTWTDAPAPVSTPSAP